jgi:hypothetical protein
MGNNEAKVTVPKPDSEEEFLPAEEEIPIPNASTSGTVTGPVVTTPQSQAKYFTELIIHADIDTHTESRYQRHIDKCF